MPGRLHADLDRLADGIFVLRAAYMLMHGRGNGMARLIEIKGLGGEVAAVRTAIRGAREAAKDLSESGSKFVAELKDVKEQIDQHRDDLRFEAESLGNSGNGSGERSEEQEKQGAGKPAVVVADETKRAPEVAAQGDTFQGTTAPGSAPDGA